MTAGFTQVFGGGPVQPSNQLYVAITLSATNTPLSWPLESAQTTAVVGDLMDIQPTLENQTVQLPNAMQGTQGLTSLINNLDSVLAFNVIDNLGNVILTAAAGTTWMIYLASNTNQQGTWRALQFGASAASVNVAALAGAGLQVIGQALAQATPNITLSTSYASSVADLANIFIWNGGSGTFTLPPVGTLNALWFIGIINAGTGVLTITPQGSSQIDNGPTKSWAISGTGYILTDGTNFWSLGYGIAGANNGFGYINLSLPASGTYTISGAQLNQISYLLTGALTGTVTLVVPASVQQYWINNQTTGNQTLTVISASSGTSVNVAQGSQVILYCDGTNIISAVTGTSLPILVNQGGTGATTPSGAVTNLGGSAVGAALFTTASAAAALATLGGGALGIPVFEAASNSALWDALVNTGSVTTGMYQISTQLLMANQGTIFASINPGGNVIFEAPLTVLPSVGAPTITATCLSGQPGVQITGTTNVPALLSLTDGSAGNRQWQIRDGARAVGNFDIFDATAGLSRLSINTSGQLVAFEPGYSLTTLENVATTNSGSFIGTLTGVTGSVTGTIYFVRNGPVVVLLIPPITGSSNSTLMTITGMPSNLAPLSQSYLSPMLLGLSSASAIYNLQANVLTSGTIQYSVGGTLSGFTSDGLGKGTQGHVLVYFLT